MRSLKTSGGITRRHGRSKLQRLTWLLSSPVRGAVSSALQELTDVGFETSEPHKDAAVTRMERDFKDAEKIVHFLLDFLSS